MSVIPARKAPALSQPTTTAGTTPVEASPAVTAPWPTHPESPDPAPKDRLCYQCQHFAKSSYGHPLGLCVEHGNRIQHSTSEPTHFGCGTFKPKAGRA